MHSASTYLSPLQRFLLFWTEYSLTLFKSQSLPFFLLVYHWVWRNSKKKCQGIKELVSSETGQKLRREKDQYFIISFSKIEMLNSLQGFTLLLETAAQDTDVSQNQICFGPLMWSQSPFIPDSHTSSQYSEQQCFPPESYDNVVPCYDFFLECIQNINVKENIFHCLENFSHKCV